MEEGPEISALRPHKTLIILLLAVFVLAHSIYLLLGIRFDDSTLAYAPQYLDPDLLSNSLFKSCFYMHIQPPLFNLYLGAVLKLAPQHSTYLYQGISILSGGILCVVLLLTLMSLRVRPWIAFTLTVLFVTSPSFVLYEHLLFYTFPAAVLLALSVFLLNRFLKSHGWGAGIAFFVTLSLLGGIRSVFHLVHYCLVVVLLLVLLWPHRKRILLTALLPFLLVASVSVKNLVLFDHFSCTTWSGLNLWILAARQMPLTEREALVSQGRISEVSLLAPLSRLNLYPERYRKARAFEDVPVLSRIKKSNGAQNYNNFSYIAISDQYGRDARKVLLDKPKYAVYALVKAWFDYFKSSSRPAYLQRNVERVPEVTKVYDHLFYGKVPLGVIGKRLLPEQEERLYIYLFLLIGLPLLLIYGIVCSLKGGAFGLVMGHRERALVSYVCFNILFVALLVNTFGFDENNRYRFMTDPLYLILLGVLAEHVMLRFASTRRH